MAKKKFPHREHVPARNPTGGNIAADVRWQNFTVSVFLILLVAGVFGQTAGFGFINYDDPEYVTANPVVEQGLTLKGMEWAMKYGGIGHWHPLTWLTHMADCQAYGLWAGGHHMTNVALHAAAVVLLFLVMREMTGKLWRSAFVAAVFAIHPLRAESVAWIAERKDVLSGVFFMLTLWVYVRYTRRPTRGRHVGMTVLYGLGLMSKNTLVTLPFVLLLLDWWPLNRMKPAASAGADGFWGKLHWALVKEKLPLFVLAAGSCVVTALVPEKIPLAHQLPVWLRVENGLTSYVTYLREMAWPVGLANPYPYPSNGRMMWEALVAVVVLAGITAVVIWGRKGSPYLVVGWLWYVGMMIPMIGVVQISYYAHADRYTYLPEIGLGVAVTWWVAEWSVGWGRRRLILGGMMAAVTAALMVCAHAQTACWKNSETLWKRALACTSGNSLASYNLAIALHDLGRLDESAAYYQKTLDMTPNDVVAECNLGNVLLEQGHTDRAMACFQKALEIQPGYAKAYCNLGNALMKQGQTDQAITCFQKALEIQPNYAKAHYDLGDALYDSGHLNEAVQHYQKALESEPDFIEAHFNLGNALLNLGRFDEAAAHYKKALELQPNYTEARNNLGAALMQMGHMAEAMSEYRKALETQPENLDVLNNLSWALATCPQASLRDGAVALTLAQKAVRLAGGENPLMLRTLAAADAETGRYAEAAETARHALQLAVQQKNDALAATLQKELGLYQMNTPVRDVKP